MNNTVFVIVVLVIIGVTASFLLKEPPEIESIDSIEEVVKVDKPKQKIVRADKPPAKTKEGEKNYQINKPVTKETKPSVYKIGFDVKNPDGYADKMIEIAKDLTIIDMFEPSDKGLSEWDFAVMNLVSSMGLNGAEDLKIDDYLRELELWAKKVVVETDRYLPQFHKNPERYYHSEGYFRMLVLASVVGLDYKVRYTKDLKSQMASPASVFFKNASDIFIFGSIKNKEGTCSSLPTLIVSIAHILGYPVHLMTSKGHLLARWVDGDHQFNFDYSGNGLISESNDYYYKWPFTITESDKKRGWYLRPLSKKEVLSIFLQLRGTVLNANERKSEAHLAYLHAHQITPYFHASRALLGSSIIRDWDKKKDGEK